MAGFTLRDRELDAVRAILDFEGFADPGPGLPWELLEHLRAVIGCDEVELDRAQPDEGSLGLLQMVGETRVFVDHEEPNPDYWRLYWSSDACSVVERPGHQGDVTKVSDFLSARQWTSSEMYAEYVRPYGQLHELSARLPDTPGQTLKILCWRGPGRDFGERERLLLELLRPHLTRAWQRAQWLRRSPSGLTDRQVELLGHVAQGLTNHQVARRMQISEGTVRTHLNHIYERLGVGSRTAAVQRLQELSGEQH